MIVGSLLLILVAVTMLIFGLAAGSSGLLIGSIAASLLAAVALVVGARQAATARAEAGPAGADPMKTDSGRTPRSPIAVDLDDDAGPATSVFGADTTPHDDGAVHRRASDAAYVGESLGDERHGDGWTSVAVADRDTAPWDTAGRDESDADSSDPTDPGISARGAQGGADFSAGTADTEILHPAHLGTPDELRVPFADVPPYRGDADPVYEGSADDSFSAWSSPGRQSAGPEAADDDADRPAFHDLPDPAQAGRDDVQTGLTSHPMESASPLLADPAQPDLRFAEMPGLISGTAPNDVPATDAVAGDPFDEDPADEPLPQRVQPTDAIRVARMTADVLVVDGRPRYHLADCPHLVGRETEPIPVGEAVDLGFTACGLCRPVDVLVGEAARR